MTLFLIRKIKSLSHKDLISSLCANWFIPLSALFFFLSNAGVTDLDVPLDKPLFDFYYSSIPALLLVLFISAICRPFSSFFSETKKTIRVIALFSSIGVSYCTWLVLNSVAFRCGGNTGVMRLVFMILSIPFTYVVNLIFWHCFEKIISGIIQKSSITKMEWIIYSVLFVGFCIYIAFSFFYSNAFYEADRYIDVIYTSDSPELIRFNCFVLIDHFENDLRQPFFAVFSAPLMGIPCLIGSLIPGIPMALFIAFSQVVMMLFSAFILAIELKLNPVQRICFVIVSSVTYTFLLFALMMEQYVVAVFWLILTVHLYNLGNDAAKTASYAASGTLLISGALVPFILKPKELSIRSVGTWVKRLAFYAIDFILMFVLFGRLNLILNVINNYKMLISFTGDKISIAGRVLQYLNFVESCFFAPETKIRIFNGGYSQWCLADVTEISYIGVVIILLSFLGFVLTRKSRISAVAFGWLCFSMIILIGIGWGTSENGLILYSLCFGWPFIVLIFNLLKLLEEKLKTKLLIPLATAVLSIILILTNFPAIMGLLNFAITEYPFK